MLTHEQLQANIAALKQQGATAEVISSYIKEAARPSTDLGITGETSGGGFARFLGMDKVGSFMGAGLAKLDPQHRANLAIVEQQDPEAARILSRGGDYTNRELLGSALETAGNIALPGAGKLLSAGGTVARIGKGAAIGTGLGAAGGLESGQDNSGVLLSAMLGGVVGGAIPLAGAMIKGTRELTSNIPEKLYSTIFKNSQDDVFKQLTTEGIKNIQDTDPVKFQELLKAGIVKVSKDGLAKVDETLAKEALDRGLKGNLKTMANVVVKTNKESELGIRTILDKVKKPIAIDNKKGLINVLTGIADGFKGQYDEASMMPVVKGFIKEVKTGKVSPRSLLDMRRLIDSQRIASTYRAMPTGKISLSQESFRSAADALRGKLNSIPGISEHMKNYSFSIDALEALTKEAQRKGNSQVVGLIDSILFTGGAAFGGTPVGVGGVVARHTLSSAKAATGLAQGINTLGRATAPIRSLTGSAIEKAKPIARTAAYNTIAGTGRVLGQ